MSRYKFFASVYDRMMDNIPYDDWEQYLLQVLYKFGVCPEAHITELGCGTGIMTGRLADDSFVMTGIDLSKEMLEVARSKETNATYLHMDMRELKLPEKQDAIISICDSVNYLLTNEDLYRTMKAARDNLKPNGIFAFDLKTEYFFINELDNKVFRENLGDFSYVWKNHYDEEEHIHTYYLEFKQKNNKTGGVQKEIHKQRAFFAGDIIDAAKRAGFKKAAVYDAFSFEKPQIHSERLYLVLKNRDIEGHIK